TRLQGDWSSDVCSSDLKLDEFLDTPEGSGRQEAEKGLPRLLQRCHWSGVLRVRFRKGGEVRYFDCMFHVMVKDDCVLGLSVLARSEERRVGKECRSGGV